MLPYDFGGARLLPRITIRTIYLHTDEILNSCQLRKIHHEPVSFNGRLSPRAFQVLALLFDLLPIALVPLLDTSVRLRPDPWLAGGLGRRLRWLAGGPVGGAFTPESSRLLLFPVQLSLQVHQLRIEERPIDLQQADGWRHQWHVRTSRNLAHQQIPPDVEALSSFVLKEHGIELPVQHRWPR